jgi:hypothetical protein
MKQFDPVTKTIGGTTFYIRPFAAFVAANLSAELTGIVAPLLAGLAPLATSDAENVMDMDVDKALPMIAEGFSSLSGDKLETLMKKLLVRHKNIALVLDGDEQILTEDVVNELFCGETQHMFVLAFEVIKVNFKGFFESVSGLSGKASGLLGRMISKNTEGLT